MHLLHERPVLDRAAIRRALDPSPLGASILPPAFQALTASDLADQVEAVTVTPEPMDTEEMSRLWSAIQAHYRPSAPLPRLGRADRGAQADAHGAAGALARAGRPGDGQGARRRRRAEPAAAVPDDHARRCRRTRSRGAPRRDRAARRATTSTAPSAVVRFAHRLLDDAERGRRSARARTRAASTSRSRPAPTADAGLAGRRLHGQRLADPARRDRPARVERGRDAARARAAAAADDGRRATRRPQRVTVTLDVSPEVRPAQEAPLTLGGDSALAEPHTTPTSTLTFELGDVPPGAQWVRLTVDGVESLLVDRSVEPPAFDPSQSVAVPA